MRLVRLVLPSLAIAGIGLACASEGAGEATAGPPPEAPDAGDSATVSDSRAPQVEAGACSAAGICVVAVPIDGVTSLTSISGSSATDVWAVGASGTIVHYDGSLWEKVNRRTPDGSLPFTMHGVWAARPNDVWILDGYNIAHSTGWNGPEDTAWSNWTHPDGCTHFSMTGNADSVLIARQACVFTGEQDVLLKFDGWADGGPLPGDALLRESGYFFRIISLSAPRTDEVWAVVAMGGPAEQATILRAKLRGDGGSPPSWEIDDGFESHTADSVYALWADEETVWLIGGGGLIRRIGATQPGGRFETVSSPVLTDLHGIFGFGPDDIWAVGEGATVLHWDGASWSVRPTPYEAVREKPRLFAVWGSSPSDVWIAGEGTMLHFQGDAP